MVRSTRPWTCRRPVVGNRRDSRRRRRPRHRRSHAAAAPSPFVFPGDAGVILNFVKADKTADFEMVLGKVKEALAKSDKPERKAQAAGWKVFKAIRTGTRGRGHLRVRHGSGGQRRRSTRWATSSSEGFAAEGQTLYKTHTRTLTAPRRLARCCI